MRPIRNRSRSTGRGNLVSITAARPQVKVRLYTAHTILTGLLRLTHNRLSDHLNFGPPILELTQVDLLSDGQLASSQPQQTAYVRKEAVLLAVDQLSDDYLASHPDLREAKDAFTVMADLGHFVVAGTLHLVHRQELASWLLEGPLFVPLTNVVVYGRGAPTSEPNVVINRQALLAIVR